MKIRHLYIKILLPFVAMLMIFWAISQTTFSNTFADIWGESHTRESRLAALALELGSSGGSQKSFEEILLQMESASGSKISITDKNGQAIALVQKENSSRHGHSSGHMSSKSGHMNSRSNHMGSQQIAINLPDGQSGFLTLQGKQEEHDATSFTAFLWLLAAASLLALLAIPVSRQITSPLKKLHKSVLKFGEGNFSHRADIQGHDEIAGLAESFNSMAEKTERVVTGGKELTANVSHELRSPLARMRIIQELLQNGLAEESPETKEQLRGMTQEIQIMDKLIDRILQFSKLDMGTIPAKNKPLDISGILADSLERHSTSFAKMNLQLHVNAPEDLHYVGDYESLVWLMDNVIGNAVKFTPEGGDVTLELARQKNTKTQLICTNTADRAIDDPDTLFEPFQRGSHESVNGSGLGLAIVKRIAEQHGGKVQARSNETKFQIFVELP
ncbi:MAG: ATP-binding protein [Desulfovibrio sp.]